MKQTNILYDASILSSNARTGIYFVAYNILKQLSLNPNYTITLYFQEDYKIKSLSNNDFITRFPFWLDRDKILRRNLKKNKAIIKISKRKIKKIFYILKYLKNCLLLFVNSFKKREDMLLKNKIYISPWLAPSKTIRNIPGIQCFVIIYDMIQSIFPEYYPVNTRIFWFDGIIDSLDKKTYYFCISEYTKKDFIKYHGSSLDKSKIFITHIAPSHSLSPLYNKTMLKVTLEKHNIPYNSSNKYILSLCTLEPRKNLIFTIKAFFQFIQKYNIHDLYFYLCGHIDNSFLSFLESSIGNLNIYKEKIIMLGYVDDEYVNTLYSNALFFTYISKYEGFGLPPLEAMQAGTPVITSDNSSLPEVVGDAAITIDCDSEEQCVKAFEDLYFNEALRKEYIAKGLERAKLFSWEKTVNKMSGIIADVLVL